MDIVSAQVFGAQRITGVEINPAMVDKIRHYYADFLEWPKWENMTLELAEGRHYVRGPDQKFDAVTLSGAEAFSAPSSGAYVLSEHYLYTVEATRDYFNALETNGTVSIFRLLLQYPRGSLCLANLYVTAAEPFGIQSPSRCVLTLAVGLGWEYRWAATIFNKEPFTPAKVDAILSRVKHRTEALAPVSGPL